MTMHEAYSILFDIVKLWPLHKSYSSIVINIQDVTCSVCNKQIQNVYIC